LERARDLMVLDGGPCPLGVESTVVDLAFGKPKILRIGAMSAEKIFKEYAEALDS
jgi:L-threonylcarbamoyladenylate synthase